MPDHCRTFASTLMAVILCLALLTASACKKKEQNPVGIPPAPVSAGLAVQKDIPLQIRVIGTVEASATVAVRAQIGGVLTRVHFVEGQDVNKGDILFSIDPGPYEAALRQAEAALARSRAQYENAKAEEKRYAELVNKGYVAQTQYEQVRTNAAALDATVQGDRALVENAKLNLSYCTIRAPFAGKTGSLVVDEGNLVKANADTPMVTILQLRTVHAAFSVPEKSLAEIRKYMAGAHLKVEAYLTQDEKDPVQGRLTFIENTVDTATGTIRLKGTFDNADRRLWPGQFVNIVLTLALQKDAVLVPTPSVQTGQAGQFVFVVKDDTTAEVRLVVVSRTFGEESVIESGLKPGETVITDGHLRVIPGAKVEVKEGKGAAVQPGSGSGGQGLKNREKEQQKEVPAKDRVK